MQVAFIGQGGHAGNLKDICLARGVQIVADSENMVIAFGGLTCAALEDRCKIYREGKYPQMIHPAAIYSPTAHISDGVHVMAGAIIQHKAYIESFCIINTRAVIEHDSHIGKGTHIAPGAIVLGNCKIGEFCFVGANAVVVQGSTVPPRTFIKAGEIWKS
jgi:UDP-3-O-[3-hydroxymyristoyl] glucosamine N-acyltransferase